MIELEKKQQKRIVSPFASNHEAEDDKIRKASDSVLFMIKNIESQIKDLDAHEGNFEDKKIRKNIIAGLSGKLKEFLLRFKKKQEFYLSKGNNYKANNLLDIDKNEISLEDEEGEQELSLVSRAKNEAINSLVKNIIDLSEIFKELNTLVVTQGTILDRIDYNLQQSLENTKAANTQLTQAANHQKCTRASGCILLLLTLILLLLLVLGLKVMV